MALTMPFSCSIRMARSPRPSSTRRCWPLSLIRVLGPTHHAHWPGAGAHAQKPEVLRLLEAEDLRRARRPAFLRHVQRPEALRRARGPRSEALRLAQAVALEAVEALEARAFMLRSTLGLFSMAHGTGALFSSAQDCQAQDSSLRSARFEATLGQVPDWVESQVRGHSWSSSGLSCGALRRTDGEAQLSTTVHLHCSSGCHHRLNVAALVVSILVLLVFRYIHQV